MPELHVNAAIFDMDGVALDSGDVYARHWRAWGAEHGIDYDEVRSRRVHPGRPAAETVRVVAPHLDAEVEAARYNATARGGAVRSASASAPMPGAAALFAALPRGRWAIATSGARAVAGMWLRNAGLPEPSVFVTIDDVERGKPAPDPFLRCLSRRRASIRVVVSWSRMHRPASPRRRRPALRSWPCSPRTRRLAPSGEADYRTGGLEDVSASFDGEHLRVTWRDAR